MSVPNIVYTVDTGDAYRNGLKKWFEMMGELDKFQGKIKGLSWDEAFEKTHDLSFLK
jgi:hypothetical protein